MTLKNASAKGRRLEHKIRDQKAAEGYLVLRAAGSLGPVDLICLSPNLGVLAIQAKANRWPGRAEMKELEALAALWSPRPEWSVWVYRQRDYARSIDKREIRSDKPL